MLHVCPQELHLSELDHSQSIENLLMQSWFHLLFEHYPTFNHESTCIIYTVMYNIDFSFTYTLNNS